MNLFLTPHIFESSNESDPINRLCIAVLPVLAFLLFSVLVCIALFFLEKKREAKLKKIEANEMKIVQKDDEESVKMKEMTKKTMCEQIKNFKLPAKYWLLVLTMTSFYSCLYPFFSLSKIFFVRKYEVSSIAAANINR